MRQTVLLSAFLVCLGCKGRDSGTSNSAETSAATRVAERATEAGAASGKPDPAMVERANQLAQQLIIVDGHVDVPYRLVESRDESGQLSEDISRRTEHGDFDYVRARQGGLDAPFMSIYIPSSYQKTGGARQFADELIDMVEGFTRTWPDKFAFATSPDQVMENHEKGLISLPMGMENGAPIEQDIANVAHFHDRGIRYITLTHARDNQICDSSYDTSHTWTGLSPFGQRVVAEMNRVGIMIDISHVSDDAFYQVLDATRVPVIASHSSLRHFTTAFERNMSDEMVKALAENGGVVMINFGSTFVRDEPRRYRDRLRAARADYAWREHIPPGSEDPADKQRLEQFEDQWEASHPRVRATVEDVADHIDRVVELAGIDHVGLGSDFDGVGDSLPTGLEDVSMYPNLFRVLLERGYSDEDIEKLASGNVFRVWRAVEEYAARQQHPGEGQPAHAE